MLTQLNGLWDLCISYPPSFSFSVSEFGYIQSNMAYGRSRASSVLDGFTLSPLPYPVLLILSVIFIFLGISWYFSYEEVVEAAEEQLGWILFATPVVLLLTVRLLSSVDCSDWFFSSSPWERRRRTHHLPSEGSSPWGVAALIVLLLIMVQYQSTFLESWFFWFGILYFVFELVCFLGFVFVSYYCLLEKGHSDYETLMQTLWLL